MIGAFVPESFQDCIKMSRTADKPKFLLAERFGVLLNRNSFSKTEAFVPESSKVGNQLFYNFENSKKNRNSYWSDVFEFHWTESVFPWPKLLCLKALKIVLKCQELQINQNSCWLIVLSSTEPKFFWHGRSFCTWKLYSRGTIVSKFRKLQISWNSYWPNFFEFYSTETRFYDQSFCAWKLWNRQTIV